MKTKTKNMLEELRALELMCSSMIKVIELHRLGIERYDDVLLRANWLRKYIDSLIKKRMKKENEN